MQRGDAAAAPETAVVEEEDVDAGGDKVRHDVGELGDVAAVAVAVERRGDRLVGVAVPGVQQLAVVGLDPHLVDAVPLQAVVGRVPRLDRLALRTEELHVAEDPPSELEGGEGGPAEEERESELFECLLPSHGPLYRAIALPC